MNGKCLANLNLDKILSGDGIFYECIEEKQCKSRIWFRRASKLAYCGKKDYVPFGICMVDNKEYFDGYFHIKESHGICRLHFKEYEESKKGLKVKLL